MRIRRSLARWCHVLLSAGALCATACGGSSGYVIAKPITVGLPVSTVVLTQNGALVSIPAQIDSTSETALVMIAGLPGGVSETYAASDTNPSGTLTFGANGSAPAGRFMPIVKVMSGGQNASVGFTLIVKMP